MPPADRPAVRTDRFSREPAMTTVRTTPARVRTDAAPVPAAPVAPVAARPSPVRARGALGAPGPARSGPRAPAWPSGP